MGAITVGLRPCDFKQLHQLARDKGRRPSDVAGILLEQAIRRATAPAADHPSDDRLTATAPRGPGEAA